MNRVPVNCSLCRWTAAASNYAEACQLADDHLEHAHGLTTEAGVSSVPDELVLTDADVRLLKMLRISVN